MQQRPPTASESRPRWLLAQSLLGFFVVLGLSLFLAPSPRAEAAVVHSVLLQLFLVLGVPVVLARLFGLQSRGVFSLRPTCVRNLSWSLVLAVSLIFVLDEVAFLQYLLTGVSASLSPDVLGLLRASSPYQLLWIIFALALVPAVCEEFLFRGLIFDRFLEAAGASQSVMMSAMLFGLFHRNLPALLLTTLAGVALAFVVFRTGSLYNAIVAHAVVNVWAVIVVNAGWERHVSWTLQAGHVPLGVLVPSVAGILLAGKKLAKTQ